MRVFLGCFLAEPSAQALAARIPTVPGMRPVPAEKLHVTLHFLGSIAPDRRAEALALAARLPGEALTVHIDQVTGFPRPARARVLVVRLDDGGRLGEWHAALADGWPTGEARPFDPHVTIGRFRRPGRAPEVDDLVGMRLSLRPPAAYRSETLPEGARYLPLEEPAT